MIFQRNQRHEVLVRIQIKIQHLSKNIQLINMKNTLDIPAMKNSQKQKNAIIIETEKIYMKKGGIIFKEQTETERIMI